MNEAIKTNDDLVISIEFKSLIRELSYSELSELENSIKEFGCLSPIVVWGSRNIIIDGHNRYDICKRNNIEYKTTNLEFLNENDAKMWVIKNQFSRRNLSMYERSILALQLETFIKEKAKENQLCGLKQNIVQQNSDKRDKEVIDTNKKLSKIAGVSHDTIERVRKIRECADEETKELLLKNKMSINEAYENIKKNEARTELIKKQEKFLADYEYDLVYTDYEFLSSICFKNQKYKLDERTDLFLWVDTRKLKSAFNLINHLNLNYANCLIWNITNKKKAKILLVAVSKSRQELPNIPFEYVHSEDEPEDKSKPQYFLNIIKSLLPNSKIKTDLFETSNSN